MDNVTPPTSEIKPGLQRDGIAGGTGLPPGFDPERSPIIAKHFFGIKPAFINRASAAARYLPQLLPYESRR